MMNQFNGYKVTCGDLFPAFPVTMTKAHELAVRLARTTGENATVYGIMENGSLRTIETARAKVPRT